jgi:asparagine synthase (glutamine-hydrolysing)
VEFAAQIPPRYTLRGLAGKLILKSAMNGLLPKEIIHRRKMGFPTPWKSWVAGPYFGRVEQLLTESRTTERKLFKAAAVRRLLQELKAGHKDHTDRLWRLINLELWQRVFVDGEGQEAKSAVVAQ